MMEIKFKCDKCGSIYKEVIVDINDNITDYFPDGWFIMNEDMVDEQLLCQDCIDLDSLILI